MSTQTLFEARPDFPRVTVNGHQISPAEIAREMQHHPAPDPKIAWHEAARALVVRELLLQEALRRHLEPDPEVSGEGTETEEESLIRQLTEEVIEVGEPDEAISRNWFERNRDRFRGPDHWDVSHILIAAVDDGSAAREKARGLALSLVRKLAGEPGLFEVLARTHSACTSATEGGRLGLVTRGETTPGFEAVMVDMKPGETSIAPVETRYGFHILRLHAFHPGKQLGWEEARSHVQEVLRDMSWRTAVARFLTGLAEESTIEGVVLSKGPLTN